MEKMMITYKSMDTSASKYVGIKRKKI